MSFGNTMQRKIVLTKSSYWAPMPIDSLQIQIKLATRLTIHDNCRIFSEFMAFFQPNVIIVLV